MGGRRDARLRRRVGRVGRAHQADRRPDLAEQAGSRADGGGDRRALSPQGHRLVRLVLPDGRCRSARGHGPPERALPAHPRPVGRVLRASDDRPVDVTHQQRRRPGPAGGLGNGRRPRARVARRRRVRGVALLSGRAAHHRLPHRRAAGDLPADPARPAGSADDATKPGSAREPVAHQRRGVYRSPHRESVRHRGARSQQVQPRRLQSVPDEHEGDGGALEPAAADGGDRRPRDGGGAGLRQPAGGGGQHDRGRLLLVHGGGAPDVRPGEEAEPRQREPPAGDRGGGADLRDARHAYRGEGAAGRRRDCAVPPR